MQLANTPPPIDPLELLRGPLSTSHNDAGAREPSWNIDRELLYQQANETRLSVALDTAVLGAAASSDAEVMRQMDELAENLGLRVTVGDDGGLMVQFGLSLTPPSDPSPDRHPNEPTVSHPSPSRERRPKGRRGPMRTAVAV